MEIALRLGVVLVLVFLITELFVNPFFELIKDKLIAAHLRKLLHKGRTIYIRPENKFFNKFGLSTGVRTSDAWIFILKLSKIIVKLYILVVIALWENGLSQTVRTQQETLPLTRAAWNQTDGSVSFTSVTPHVALRESMVSGFPVFDTLAKQNTGNYTKARNTQLELRYFSNCVQDIDNLRTIYFAVFRRTKNGTETVCLDGEEGRDNMVLMTFNPNNEQKKETTVQSMNLIRPIATDGVTQLFAVELKTSSEFQGRTDFQGYVSLTKQSHFSNNVGWSFYGFATGTSNEIFRINIAVSSFSEGQIPCPLSGCLGTWRFTEDEALDPSDQVVEGFQRKDFSNQFESINLTFRAPLRTIDNQELKIALSWLAETPYAIFKAEKRFIDDVMGRLTGNVFFFSDMGSPTRSFKAFNTKEVTTISSTTTPLLISALTFLLVFGLISLFIEFQSKRVFGIRNDVIGRETLLEIYRNDVLPATAAHESNQVPLGIIVSNGISKLGAISDTHQAAAHAEFSTLEHEFP